MSKGKTFIRTIVLSITSPKYYQDIFKATYLFSFKYFLTLGLIAGMISIGALAFRTIPNMKIEINKFLDTAGQYYPDDIVIKSENGAISVNRPGVFIIPMPKEFLDYQNTQLPQDAKYPEKLQNFIVLNPEGTVEDLEKNQTLFLINSTNIVSMGQQGVQSKSTKGIPNGEFSKQNLTDIIKSLKTYADYIPYIIFFFIWILWVAIVYVTKLTQAFFYASVFWIISQILKVKLSLFQSYKMVLHTTTLPILLETIVLVINPNVFPSLIALIIGIIHLILGIYILVMLKKGLK